MIANKAYTVSDGEMVLTLEPAAILVYLGGGQQQQGVLPAEGGKDHHGHQAGNEFHQGQPLSARLFMQRGVHLRGGVPQRVLDRVATRIVHLDGGGNVRLHPGDMSSLIERMKADH